MTFEFVDIDLMRYHGVAVQNLWFYESYVIKDSLSQSERAQLNNTK